MGVLSERARKKVAGPAWNAIRPAFEEINDALLSVSPDSFADLTTVYIKYCVSSDPTARVFAVIWVKTSKELVVGLALPDDLEDARLSGAPPGTTYKGLTRYFAIKSGDSVPDSIGDWARSAYELTLT